MSMPQRVSDFLEDAHVPYHLVEHPHSASSISTAVAAQVPYSQIAKAVMLLDNDGHKLMAILPANRKISLSKLGELMAHSYRLEKEQKVYEMFTDCEHGAVPPFASAYHLDMIYDDSLLNNQVIFLESGDHQTLIKLSSKNFRKLMGKAKHDQFSHGFMH